MSNEICRLPESLQTKSLKDSFVAQLVTSLLNSDLFVSDLNKNDQIGFFLQA